VAVLAQTASVAVRNPADPTIVSLSNSEAFGIAVQRFRARNWARPSFLMAMSRVVVRFG